MLEVRTAPVLVTGYRVFEREGKPVARRDGTVVEFVAYTVEGEERVRETLLDGSVNGSRVDAGTRAHLVMRSEWQEKAVRHQNGDYVQHRTRDVVTGFEPVK